jgi:2-deoxy-D-gluconate 3-dehydrogenase
MTRPPPPDPFALTDRLAVVTGASRGMGLAIAGALAEAGADVVGVSSTMASSGHDARTAVESAGRSFVGIEADLGDRGELGGLVEQLVALDRPVDILVNNAGVIAREPAATHTDADWDRVLQVNLSSPFVLSRELGAQMVGRGRGKIIFIASLLSFQGGITVPGYTAAKSGLAGLTKALANEWAAHGVNVNAVAPGYIATDNTRALRSDPDRNRAIAERIPAGRWGRPEDVVGAVRFLAAPASDYVHGVVLPVDGGWLGR